MKKKRDLIISKWKQINTCDKDWKESRNPNAGPNMLEHYAGKIQQKGTSAWAIGTQDIEDLSIRYEQIMDEQVLSLNVFQILKD